MIVQRVCRVPPSLMSVIPALVFIRFLSTVGGVDGKTIAGAVIGSLLAIVVVVLLIVYRHKVAACFSSSKKPKDENTPQPYVEYIFVNFEPSSMFQMRIDFQNQTSPKPV